MFPVSVRIALTDWFPTVTNQLNRSQRSEVWHFETAQAQQKTHLISHLPEISSLHPAHPVPCLPRTVSELCTVGDQMIFQQGQGVEIALHSIARVLHLGFHCISWSRGATGGEHHTTPRGGAG